MGMGAPIQSQGGMPAQGKGTAPVVKPGVTTTPIQPQSPYRPIGSQGGKGGGNIDPVRPRPFENGPGPQVPAQGKGQPGQQPAKGGTLPQFALPSHYQSPYANYGFDPGLQSYLDQQNYRSYNDAGVAFQYDPTNQTFTGGTMGGTYNPIPLSVMQQAAGGNRDVLSPYFQSRFPQPTGPVPTVKPGLPSYAQPPVQQPAPVQPTIPAQGGKAPLTQEQIAALPPNIDPVRPMPQVQQPAPVMPRPMPQVMPRQPGKPQPGKPQPGKPQPGKPQQGLASLTQAQPGSMAQTLGYTPYTNAQYAAIQKANPGMAIG